MATITQTAPFSDTTQVKDSDAYFNQLEAGAATLPITWTTLVASPAFVVSPNGNIATSALIQPGNYTASGTMVDALSNTGIWDFTLTVVEIISPPTTVIASVPPQPITPTGIEVAVPFRINPATGGVQVVTDYSTIISQHVLSVLMTATNERVMLPTYGVGMQNEVFQPQTGLVEAALQSRITQFLKQWEPAVTVQNVSVFTNPAVPEVMNVTVTYSTTPYNATNTITVSLGGSIPTAPISTIGTFTP